MVRRVSKRHQCEDRIHHCRIDRSQTVGTFEMLHHPRAREAHSATPSGLGGKAVVEFERLVEGEKKSAPIETLSLPFPGERELVREQFVEAGMWRHGPIWFSRVENR